MRVLITGGCGFVGHHFVEHFLKNTLADIVILDRLSYASNGFQRLRDIRAYDDARVTVVAADFTQPISPGVKREIGSIDYIIHIGAESHVDTSIADPLPFVRSNVEGTKNMLDLAYEIQPKTFFYFSTDEVFGPAPSGIAYTEDDPHNPSNPYAATKSGGEMLVKAYRNTYNLPCVITRTMNIIGERQHPEKFVPKVINAVRAGETVYIHGDTDGTPGSRFYIHARNVADGYLHLIRNDIVDGEYHITGEKEMDNLTLAQLIAQTLDAELTYEIVDFHAQRPGHDLRYALSGQKMKEIGWAPPHTLEKSLTDTVLWSVAHPAWLHGDM